MSIPSSPSTESISVLPNVEDLIRNHVHPDLNLARLNDYDGLLVRAYNVGEANFIVLKKDNKAVIIDAGAQSYSYYQSIPERRIIEMLNDVTIEAVFLTHPHKDHYNLIFNSNGMGLIFINYRDFFIGTDFYFGGREDDWKNIISIEIKEQLNSIKPNNLLFVDNQMFYSTKYLNDVDFTFLAMTAPNNRSKENKLSLLLQVTYKGQIILFPGDAEGDSLSRLFLSANDISSLEFLCPEDSLNDLKQLSDVLHQYVNGHLSGQTLDSIPQVFSYQYWYFYYRLNLELNCLPPLEDLMGLESLNWEKQDFINTLHEYTIQMIRILAIRKLFRNSKVIFLPHHGSESENSQAFLGLFGAIEGPHLFIICSSPFDKSKLPNASTIEMAPLSPTQLPHPVIYSRKDIESYHQLKLTSKPIYMTGASPGGFIDLIIDDNNVFIADYLRRQNNNLVYQIVNAFTNKIILKGRIEIDQQGNQFISFEFFS